MDPSLRRKYLILTLLLLVHSGASEDVAEPRATRTLRGLFGFGGGSPTPSPVQPQVQGGQFQPIPQNQGVPQANPAQFQQQQPQQFQAQAQFQGQQQFQQQPQSFQPVPQQPQQAVKPLVYSVKYFDRTLDTNTPSGQVNPQYVDFLNEKQQVVHEKVAPSSRVFLNLYNGQTSPIYYNSQGQLLVPCPIYDHVYVTPNGNVVQGPQQDAPNKGPYPFVGFGPQPGPPGPNQQQQGGGPQPSPAPAVVQPEFIYYSGPSPTQKPVVPVPAVVIQPQPLSQQPITAAVIVPTPGPQGAQVPFDFQPIVIPYPSQFPYFYGQPGNNNAAAPGVQSGGSNPFFSPYYFNPYYFNYPYNYYGGAYQQQQNSVVSGGSQGVNGNGNGGSSPGGQQPGPSVSVKKDGGEEEEVQSPPHA